jgi:hypothetical protein
MIDSNCMPCRSKAWNAPVLRVPAPLRGRAGDAHGLDE